MTTAIDTTINGVHLTLLARRAAYSKQHQTLFVADTHFGKDATFRHFGIPVPSGTCAGTLRKLSHLIETTSAQRLVILGDMFHARSSLSLEVCTSIDTFFQRHTSLAVSLVRGNHDDQVGRLPCHWPIEVIQRGSRIGRIALGHEPQKVPADADVVLCGHLHPSVRVGNRRDSLGKMPCFWLSSGCLVFPAFGEFTGTHTVHSRQNDRVWIIADNAILEQSAPERTNAIDVR